MPLENFGVLNRCTPFSCNGCCFTTLCWGGGEGGGGGGGGEGGEGGGLPCMNPWLHR